MNCPHCGVTLVGTSICPKCKYDTRYQDGGDSFKNYIKKKEEALKDVPELFRCSCGNRDFINVNGEYQCRKCGKFLSNRQVEDLKVISPYLKKKKEAELQEKLSSGRYELIADIYLYASISHSDQNPELYIDKAEIYRSKQNYSNRFLTVYHANSCGYELLFIESELPKFGLGGGGGSAPIYVQNPDKVVYTGATIGGITTGGFSTVSGGGHWETVSWSGSTYLTMNFHLLGEDISGSRDGKKEYMVAVNKELVTIPDRLKRKAYKIKSKPDFMDIGNLEMGPSNITDILSGEIRSDEQLYNEACRLKDMPHPKTNDYRKAISYFEELGNYKESVINKGQCEHRIGSMREQEEADNKFEAYIIAVIGLLIICLIGFLSA